MPNDTRLTIRRPDDWHVHLRDGDVMRGVLPYTVRQFARAIVMPNLSPPIADVDAAIAYRERILAALPQGSDFTPLMTCYLTDSTDPAELARGFAEGVFTAAKLYPAHATTGSAHGVTDVANIAKPLETMQDIGMPLLVHGEVTDPGTDIFDREAVFIERILAPLVGRLPDLKKRINYYKESIPTEIEDQYFFAHLASELKRHNVELLELQQTGNRVWLGQLSKTDEERYLEEGLDINAIKQIRTSTFKIRAFGEFDDVLTVFENLKTMGRLYTVDQIISPAGGGGGTVLVNNSGTAAQMEITGSLYYGIPANYRDAEGLDKKYMEVAVIRNAQEISNMVKGGGREILHPGQAGGDSKAGEAGGQDGEQAVEVDNSIQSGVPAGASAFGGRG